MDITAVNENPPTSLTARNHVGETIDRREKTRLAAARRTNQRSDTATINVQRDFAQCSFYSVAKRKFLHLNQGLRLATWRPCLHWTKRINIVAHAFRCHFPDSGCSDSQGICIGSSCLSSF